jgi:gag-polypeptide of LTR copia-type/Zinc knuckle
MAAPGGAAPAGLDGNGQGNIFRDASQHGIGAEKSSSIKLEVSKFEGKDYHLWEFQLKSILKVQGYWGIVCGAILRPQWPMAVRDGAANFDAYERHVRTTSDNAFANAMIGTAAAGQAAALANFQFEWDKIDSIAKTTIITSVNYKYLQVLTSCNTAHETWVRLRSKFLEVSLPNQMRLEEEYRQVKMRRGMDIMAYINKLESYVDRLRGVGMVVPENTKVACLLRGLGPEYESIQTNILSNPAVTYEMAVNQLIQWSSLRGMRVGISDPDGSVLVTEGDEDSEDALFARRFRGKNSRGRGRGGKTRSQGTPRGKSFKCYGCGKEGHIMSQCPQKTNPTSKAVCYTCNKVGHISPDCPMRGKRGGSSASDSAITFVAFGQDPDMRTSSYEVVEDLDGIEYDFENDKPENAFVARKVKTDDWILDSGATQNMCNEISHFSKLKKLERPKKIMIGDSTIIKSEHVGEVNIFTS